MKNTREVYPVEVAGIKRDLRIFEIKPGLRIAILNMLGDTELVQAAAKALAEKLAKVNYDLLVTGEAKSIPLIHALAVTTAPLVLRKACKPWAALQAETLSITGVPQTLSGEGSGDQGKKVVLLDDVISTGSALQGMRLVVAKPGPPWQPSAPFYRRRTGAVGNIIASGICRCTG